MTLTQKIIGFIIVHSLVCLTAVASAHANNPPHSEGGGLQGGGGSGTEERINEIRADILKWISEGGAQNLSLVAPMTVGEYESLMTPILQKHAVVLEATNDKVEVNGVEKTCRSFVSENDQLPHMLCNISRFEKEGEAGQYKLVHHEYAGLVGVEDNIAGSSDYDVSTQLTASLERVTVLRLAVKKSQPTTKELIWPAINGYKVSRKSNYYGICKALGFAGTVSGSVTLAHSFGQIDKENSSRQARLALIDSEGKFVGLVARRTRFVSRIACYR